MFITVCQKRFHQDLRITFIYSKEEMSANPLCKLSSESAASQTSAYNEN